MSSVNDAAECAGHPGLALGDAEGLDEAFEDDLRHVHRPPIYPEVAKAARVSGVVILEATIGEDGIQAASPATRT